MICYDIFAGLKISLIILWCCKLRSSVAQENNPVFLNPTTDGNSITLATSTTILTTSPTIVSSSATKSIQQDSGTSVPTQKGPSSTVDDNENLPTDLPTLTGGYTIVPPSVPPTQNAPFMQQSTLPEGTVFIVVGAVLGFLAVSVLVWRMGVAWCLHRSVKKAAFTQNASDTKAIFRTTAATSANRTTVYNYSAPGSAISLSGLGGTKGGKTGRAGGIAQISSNNSSLFFSPTAGANNQNGANRGSSYFPAGFYSAGSSGPDRGLGPMAHHGPAISLSNLSTYSQGYGRSRSIGSTPPDSPIPSNENYRNFHPSSSVLTLSQQNPGIERAPSAYLDDLFDGENITSPVRGRLHI